MESLAGGKKLINIVSSPRMALDSIATSPRKIGEDPVEVCRYFGSRDRINHVHLRNVRVQKPYENYAEVWLDEAR